MEQISQRTLRNDSGAVLRAVEDGETYEITVSGRPVARLSPLPDERRRLVPESVARGIAAVAPVDGGSWRSDIDAAFDDEMDDDPWADSAR